MEIRRGESIDAIDRFALTLVGIRGVCNRCQWAVKSGVVKSVPPEGTRWLRKRLHAECRQFFMHGHNTRQDSGERV